MFSYLFVVALWSPAGKGLTSWLSCLWCFIVFLLLSHVLSWVRCGAWLYRYLIFAFFLTFMMKSHLLNNSLCRYTLLRSNSNVNQQHMLLGEKENFIDVYTCFVPGPLHMPHNQDACFSTTKMFIFTRQLFHPICSLLTWYIIGFEKWRWFECCDLTFRKILLQGFKQLTVFLVLFTKITVSTVLKGTFRSIHHLGMYTEWETLWWKLVLPKFIYPHNSDTLLVVVWMVHLLQSKQNQNTDHI